MKYLCLIYYDERLFGALPDDEIEGLWSEAGAYALVLRDGRGYLAAEALEPTAAATTVRRRNGQISITDGPFAETKEQLGGFILIDAANLDEAIEVAAKVPSARLGSVEIRPVRQSPQLQTRSSP